MTQRKHIIISGTGRAGTTFLMELLTKLGLDTGYSNEDLVNDKDKNGRAGLEITIADFMNGNAPYIVKSPWFCDHMDEIMNDETIGIDHVLIPIRDIKAAAESRAFVSKMAEDKNGGKSILKKVAQNIPVVNKTSLAKDNVPGGLWQAGSQKEQEFVLYEKLTRLLLEIAKTDVPVTLIHYPTLTKDAKYLYQKLQPLLNDMEWSMFEEIFNATVRPDLVHSFTQKDQ